MILESPNYHTESFFKLKTVSDEKQKSLYMTKINLIYLISQYSLYLLFSKLIINF